MQLSESEHVFLTVCGKVLRYWTLTAERSLEAVQSIQLDSVDDLRSVFICPTNTTFVALSRDSWRLYSATNPRCFQQVQCPFEESGGWRDGAYIDAHHVLAWTGSGQACLYRIPDMSHLPPMDFGAGSQRNPPGPQPDLKETRLLCTFSLPSGSDSSVSMLGSLVIGCCSPSREYLCLADEHGSLSLFKIPTGLLQYIPTSEEGLVANQDVPAFEMITSAKFSQYWDSEEAPLKSVSPVTASCILPKSLTLLLGHEDGGVTIRKLPRDENPRHLSGCHRGKVTALMNATSSDYPNLLFTGGDDCRIHMWDMDTGEWLRSWAYHCGSIQHLVSLPSQADGLPGEGCFMSVSSDNSVGLFSFDPPRPKPLRMFTGHQTPVTSLSIRADQDYLLVSCKDSTVTVWELSTGEYEGCYPSTYIQEITDMPMTELTLSRRRVTGDMQIETQSTMTLFSCDRVPKRPCGNVLLLNVRHLLSASLSSEWEMGK